jgi:F-type H+-transporting ATPase subunit gamma
MASSLQIKSRIRSVRSTRQITKAMELVASSKLRRAQDAVRASSSYATTARELLTRLSGVTDVRDDVFFKPREIKARLIIIITSNRGLAGSYNAGSIKKLIEILEQDKKEYNTKVRHQVICIGKKGAQFVSKLSELELIGTYSDLPENISASDIRPILLSGIEKFKNNEVDAVDIVTTRFISSMTQTPEVIKLLPVNFDKTEVSRDIELSSFEPSVERVLDGAVIRLLEVQLYQAVLDACASEHSMRRSSMKNATDNASDIVDSLTLEMNKIRQSTITQELSEISAGVEAIK